MNSLAKVALITVSAGLVAAGATVPAMAAPVSTLDAVSAPAPVVATSNSGSTAHVGEYDPVAYATNQVGMELPIAPIGATHSVTAKEWFPEATRHQVTSREWFPEATRSTQTPQSHGEFGCGIFTNSAHAAE